MDEEKRTPAALFLALWYHRMQHGAELPWDMFQELAEAWRELRNAEEHLYRVLLDDPFDQPFTLHSPEPITDEDVEQAQAVDEAVKAAFDDAAPLPAADAATFPQGEAREDPGCPSAENAEDLNCTPPRGQGAGEIPRLRSQAEERGSVPAGSAARCGEGDGRPDLRAERRGADGQGRAGDACPGEAPAGQAGDADRRAGLAGGAR